MPWLKDGDASAEKQHGKREQKQVLAAKRLAHL
jgi:hypothetical protein